MLSKLPSVSLRGIQLQTVLAIVIANDIFTANGRECVITSVADGKHSRGSLHYAGAAVDLRSRHLTTTEKENILADLKAKLNTDYDVILEATHFHIEYQPKEPA